MSMRLSEPQFRWSMQQARQRLLQEALGLPRHARDDLAGQNAARKPYEGGGFVHADTCLVYTLVLPQFLVTAGQAGETAAACR